MEYSEENKNKLHLTSLSMEPGQASLALRSTANMNKWLGS